MAVLKTTSPIVCPVAPIDFPINVVPSARAKIAVVIVITLIFLNFCHKKTNKNEILENSKVWCIKTTRLYHYQLHFYSLGIDFGYSIRFFFVLVVLYAFCKKFYTILFFLLIIIIISFIILINPFLIFSLQGCQMKLNPCLLSFSVVASMYSTIAIADTMPTTTLQTITIVAQNTTNKHQKDDISHTDSIPAKQADTLGDYLPQIAGVTVGGSSTMDQHISIRGIGSDFKGSALKITVDGMRQPETRGFHHMGVTSLDPDLLKATEVSVGNNSVTLGNNAIGGAVAFRTVDAEDLLRPDEKVGARVKLGYASNDKQFHSTATAYGKPTDNSDVLVSYGQRKSDGGEDGDGRHIQGDDITIKNILAKASFKPAEGHKISASYQQYDNKGTYPFRPNIGYQANVVAKANRNTVDIILPNGSKTTNLWPGFMKNKSYSIGYDYNPNDNLDVSAKLYRVENENFVQGFTVASPTTMTPNSQMYSEGETTGFNWNVNQNLATKFANKNVKHRLTYGTETYEKSLTTNQKVEGKSMGFYLQDRMDFGRFSLTPGVRFDKYKILGESYDDVSGALSGEFRVLDNTTLFASYTQLFNGVPVPEGIHINSATVIYNPSELKPETGANAEIGFNTRFAGLIKDNDSLSFTAKYFNTDFKDKIENKGTEGRGPTATGFDCTTGIWQTGGTCSKYINAGDVEYKGYEIMSSYRLNQFGANFGYAHAKSKNAQGYQLSGDSGDQITLGLNYGDIDNYLVGLNIRHAKSLNRKTSATDVTKLASATVLDLTGSYKPAKFKNVSIDAGIYNLTDETYAEHTSNASDYAMGRNVKLAVTYQF